MDKNKHMDIYARLTIQGCLDNGKSFKAIGKETGKDCTTIAKEVKNHFICERKGAYGRSFCDCVHYTETCRKPDCQKNCTDYQKYDCPLLSKPPYVCNNCKSKGKCTLEKHIYDAVAAQREYTAVKSECREGFNLTEGEISALDDIISPLILKGQSIHHICVTHADSIPCCEKSIYAYTNSGVFRARNIDLPRKVSFRPRKKKSVEPKVDKTCRIGRTYRDFGEFMKEHPALPVVELDSVEGVKGGAVLLTVHFVLQKFQLAFRRDHNDSQSVIDIFNRLYDLLGRETYLKLFPVLLCDNGSEFSNPKALEFDKGGRRRSYVFYCDPSAPGEKGSCEVNHEFIRRVIPKSTDIAPYSQEDIDLMMSHINSYARPELGDKTPYAMVAFYFGKKIPEKLKIRPIAPVDIELKPALLLRRHKKDH